MPVPLPPLSPEAIARIQWIPETIFRRVTGEEIFGRNAPLEVDFGCGEGAFLLAMAKRFPERNFLGTERLLGRVEGVCKKAARAGLENLKVLRLESLYTVTNLLPRDGVSVAYVFFPDPWPKRAHHARRLFQEDFLEQVRLCLEPGGELRLKTDDLPYFQWMEKVISRASGWERLDWLEEPDYPVTNFEARFVAQGLPIHRARLRKL
ncbi:MAG: tRNA ((46)-N7)-methyltransferase TrmB [Verrucomicrobiota bacterium]|jgi:tRNA (guanine-N7-)-methyltransferase